MLIIVPSNENNGDSMSAPWDHRDRVWPPAVSEDLFSGIACTVLERVNGQWKVSFFKKFK